MAAMSGLRKVCHQARWIILRAGCLIFLPSMDELVKQAMLRWPDVPAVRGWLRLDRRGVWYLIDRGQPGFDEQQHGLGSPITSPQIIDFIGRNYLAQTDTNGHPTGQWYWQNGPQKVWVSYDLAPLIVRVLQAKPSSPEVAPLVTHTGYLVGQVISASISALGNVHLQTDLGPAVIHDMDLGLLSFEGQGPDAVVLLGQLVQLVRQE
jgi:Protein of unknown function (DUF2946)